MRPLLTIFALLLLSPAARAGLYVSVESLRELPSDWRGFLPDHRALRMTAAPAFIPVVPTGPLRDTYADAALKLESAARTRPLTVDEAADLGGLYVRLGEPAKAVELLRRSAREHPDHFRTAANLGTAWHLTGDLTQAEAALEEAVRLAPEDAKPAERLHLKLVRLRKKEGPGAASGTDALFDETLPPDALALIQRLALWMPGDGRLLWQVGEIAHTLGDDRAAANILDGCATEYGMRSELLQARRREYRAAADAREKAAGHRPGGGIAFRSSRPLSRTFDPARLPAVNPDGVNPLPWPALTETEFGKGFRPVFLKYVEQLDGKRVSLAGFPAPGRTDGGFLLTEFPVGCWFCETPGPTQVVAVELAAEADPHGRGAVKVTGVLRLNRTDPERHLFAIEAATVGSAD